MTKGHSSGVHRISVDIKDTNKIPMGMGFYDNYEGILNFAVKRKGKFHSYIQSERLSIDVDKHGNLLNIEASVSKDRWVSDHKLVAPQHVPVKDIRFLDYRLNIAGESYYTNDKKDLLYICFSKENHLNTFEIAENLLADVNVVSELAGLWVLNIVEDYGFKSEMAFRRGDKANPLE